MAIASRAREAHLQRVKGVETRNPGLADRAFPAKGGTDPAVGIFIEKFGRFMDRKELRETLLTVAQSHEQGALGESNYGNGLLSMIQTDAEIAALSATIGDSSARGDFLRSAAAKRARAHRLLPRFGNFGRTYLDQIHDVVDQHRAKSRPLNGFKAPAANRFV
jgi:hypothetical protein